MNYPHVIRLRGPWHIEPIRNVAESDLPVASQGTRADAPHAQVPGDWASSLGSAFRGTARYLRRFHVPSNLDPHERVWLCCQGAHQRATVALNGLQVGRMEGATCPVEFDITRRLRGRNELAIEVTCEDALQPGGLGEVRLEIRASH